MAIYKNTTISVDIITSDDGKYCDENCDWFVSNHDDTARCILNHCGDLLEKAEDEDFLVFERSYDCIYGEN